MWTLIHYPWGSDGWCLGLVVGSLWAMSVEAGSGTQSFGQQNLLESDQFVCVCVCVCMGFFSLFAAGFVHGNLCSRPDPVWWATLFIQRKEHTSCNNNNTLCNKAQIFRALFTGVLCMCTLPAHSNCSHTFVGLLNFFSQKTLSACKDIHTEKVMNMVSWEEEEEAIECRCSLLSAFTVYQVSSTPSHVVSE
jgi:hypothetical protein